MLETRVTSLLVAGLASALMAATVLPAAAEQSPAAPSTPQATAPAAAPASPATTPPAAPVQAPSSPQAAAPAPSSPAAAAATATAPVAPTAPAAAPSAQATAAPAAPATPAASPSAPPTTPATAAAPAAAPASPTPSATAPQAAPAQAATVPPTPAPSAPAATATPPTQPAQPAAQAAAPAVPAADPVVAAVRTRLADTALFSKVHPDDLTALQAFYAERSGGPLWVGTDGFNAKAKSLVAEIRKAADWGLDDKDFLFSAAPAGATPEALADPEARLSLAAMTYVRFARGGRINPGSLSRILDLDPEIRDPKTVIADLAASDAPDSVLRGAHPRHPQFEALRQALLKARGPAEPEVAIDPALRIKLPGGKAIKPGTEHADIVLLRQRLKIPADSGVKETLLDDKLAEALKAFQFQKGLQPNGALTGATRNALNAEGEVNKKQAPDVNIQRILINMEKWRWLPVDLGPLYVWSNVPEFYARVMKKDKEIFKEKIIAGQPEWATPTFSANMQFIVFNPSWGVPDGIKMRELLPRLQRAGGGSFFEQLFGGGGGSAEVLRAYGLTAYRNGRPVDPSSINLNEIRSYAFTQPPGAKNPLGMVKFRFPNKHDVYMHDTTERHLFAQSYRALSHGCMRVQNPRLLADILLDEDKGWSPEEVSQAIRSSGEITLSKPIPVYVTYFTAMVGDDGKISYFGDIYGHDSRISSALGRPMTFEAPRPKDVIDMASADPIPGDGSEGGLATASTSTVTATAPVASAPGTKKDKNKNKKKREQSTGDLISGSLSGLVAN